jgi:4-hydroxybenzoate polyprenyltransferase
MKNKTYLLNTILAAVLGIYLLGAVLVRTFLPLVILPEANIPNLTLIGLIALVLEHYLNPYAKRCYVCVALLSAVTFGLLPFAASMVTAMQALELALIGGVVFTVVTALFSTIQDRLSSGPAAKASAFFSAVSLYMAAQCFTSILL